jgi:hypothetical protein
MVFLISIHHIAKVCPDIIFSVLDLVPVDTTGTGRMGCDYMESNFSKHTPM